MRHHFGVSEEKRELWRGGDREWCASGGRDDSSAGKTGLIEVRKIRGLI